MNELSGIGLDTSRAVFTVVPAEALGRQLLATCDALPAKAAPTRKADR
jgi:hypothetical protein